MQMTIDAPFIAHSELTNEIYVIDKKAKYCVTDQVMKAVVATNRAIPKDQYNADMVAMLDKISDDIESCREDEEPHVCDYRHHRNEGLDMVLDIIDKYKAECQPK